MTEHRDSKAAGSKVKYCDLYGDKNYSTYGYHKLLMVGRPIRQDLNGSSECKR